MMAEQAVNPPPPAPDLLCPTCGADPMWQTKNRKKKR
jgi:hypothetical protein